jgi:hypothetical protein
MFGRTASVESANAPAKKAEEKDRLRLSAKAMAVPKAIKKQGSEAVAKFLGPQKMGLARTPAGVIIGSYRLTPDLAVANLGGESAEIINPDAADAEFVAALFSSMDMSGGRRRRKFRGGANLGLGALKNWALSLPDKVKRAAAAVGAAVTAVQGSSATGAVVNAGIAASQGASLAGAKVNEVLQMLIQNNPAFAKIPGKTFLAAKAGAYLLYSLATFGGAGIQAIIGTATGIVNNASGLLQTGATQLMDEAYQQSWADAISKDWPTAALVSVAALTQAGVLSLTTVVAVILRVFGMAITGPARASATAAIYLWYLGKPPAQQTEIKKAAADYYSAAKEVSQGAGEAAVAAGSKVAEAAGRLGAAVAGGAVAVANKMRGPGAAGPAPTEAQAASAAAEAATTLAAGGGAAVSAASAEVAAEVVKAVTEAPPAASAGVPGSAKPAAVIAEEAGKAASAVEEVKAKSKKKGGRKTRKVSSTKRRATRRRKPSKYLAAPVFAY